MSIDLEKIRTSKIILLVSSFMIPHFVFGISDGFARVTLTPILLKELYLAPFAIGIANSIYGIFKMGSNVFSGALSDKLGRKTFLVLGPIIWGLGFPFISMAQSVWHVVIGRMLFGLGIGTTGVALWGTVTDYTRIGERAMGLGYSECVLWLAISLGSLLGAILMSSANFSLRQVMFLGFPISILAALLFYSLVKEPKEYRTAASRHVIHAKAKTGTIKDSRKAAAISLDREYKSSVSTVIGLLGAKNAIPLYFSGFICKLVTDGVCLILYPLYIESKGLLIINLGILLFAFDVIFALVQPFVGSASDRFLGRRKMLILGLAVMTLASFLSFFSVSFEMFLSSAILMGVGGGIIYPTAPALMGDIAEIKHRGVTLGIYRFWRDLGAFLGPILVVTAIVASGVLAAFTFIGILGIIGVCLVLFLARETVFVSLK